MLAQHLAQAEDDVASGRRAIIRQRELILDLDRDGHETGEARRLLATFEEMQKLHVADRDRLLKELAESLASRLIAGAGQIGASKHAIADDVPEFASPTALSP
jgi:hypothetical protein